MKRFAAILLAVIAAAIAVPLIAQETADQGKDWLVQFVEGQLSAPDRQISLSGINGVLSSDVTIPEITISDKQGVWLRIDNAVLNWDQGALLGGKLQINRLSADRIDYIRAAVPAEGIALPAPEAQKLEIPQLPVAVVIGELSVPSVTFGEQVFGLGSEIAVTGRLQLADGSLDTALAITRKDGPGGNLSLALKYDRATAEANIDLSLNEPPDGVIVNLLGMDGKPDLALRLTGSGPLDSLRTDLSLDAGGKRALTGVAQLSRADTGIKVDANLKGPIADLVPSAYKNFFGAETSLTTALLVRDGGGVSIDSLAVRGGELALDATADTAADGFLTRLKLDAKIASVDGTRVLLPGGGETTVSAAQLNVDYGTGDTWTARLTVDQLETAALSAQSLTLDFSGAAVGLADPANRRITFNADGALSGIASDDPQIVEALGTSLGLGIAGLWSPETALRVAEARLRGKAFDLVLAGLFDQFAFAGDVRLSTPSIAPFSGLAGRQLGGRLDLGASGRLEPLSGGFDLTLSGTADDLALGLAPLDPLLVGRTTLGGRLARTEAGFSADGFEIGNAQSRITADGSFASDKADFRFGIAVADLSRVSENAGGALTATGTAKGSDGVIALAFDAGVPNGKLSNHNLTEAKFGFAGTLNGSALSGNFAGAAFLDGHRIDLAAGLASKDGVNRLSGLTFTTQGTVLTGDVTQGADNLLTGKLALDSRDVSLAAALLLTEAKGAATAAIDLAPQDGKQAANVTATLSKLIIDTTTRVDSARLDARINDLFGVPAIDGTIDGSGIEAAGLLVDTLSAKASQGGDATAFSASAALDNGTKLAAAGSLSPQGEGYRVVLDSATLDQGAVSAKLVGSTSATLAGDVVILESASFAVGKGRITSSGTAGKSLDLTVDLADVPLSVANAVVPDLGLGGQIGGKVHVTGAASAPDISFEVSGSGIKAAAIADFGVTPLSVSARGSFAKQTLHLTGLKADGPSGTTIAASGTLPMAGSGGSLAVTGSIPLAIGNSLLSSRGAQLFGTLSLDASVSGSLERPAFGGTISTTDAGVVDPLSNLRLGSIVATARLSEKQIAIERFSAALATGGSISASGAVSLDADAGFPADLGITLNSARYADGNLFVATASGQLALKGPLLKNPLLSGSVALEKAEIAIPDSISGDAGLLQVDHKFTPPGVETTLKRIESNATGSSGTSGSGSLQLDISVTAPNQVFVRGRGVDAELGGQVRLTGPISAIEPVGGFDLIRGRLTILGQRVNFTSGSVSLTGDFNPYIDLTASSPGDGITVQVTVRGPVSDLDITFSSTPELPQDEVLAQLIFKRTLGDLSPLQLAKLAAAASELAGGSNPSLVDSLRSAAGLADLDVITDSSGNTAVKAGTYLQDNLYVSVEAGTQGKNKVSIDLDLGNSVKASGSTSNDGETSVGIYYEQDF